MNIKSILKNCVIFSDIDDDSISELQKIAILQNFNSNELVFSEGDEAAALYILVSGVVDLVKTNVEGKEKLFRRVEKGEMFAEAAMFSGDIYPATAIVREHAQVVLIEKSKFLGFVKRRPEVAMKIMGAMARLLKHLNKLLTDLSLGSVASRLAAYFVARSREGKSLHLELGIKKRELAASLGTIPETLSRNLKKFSDDGLITIRGSKVTINDIKELEALSGK